MYSPTGLAAGDDGTLYVVELVNNIVRKISPAGIITTIAGTGGVPGDSGDGGPATSAKLSTPVGIDLDHDGSLYVSDNGNNKIKKLEAVTHTVTFDKNGGDTEAVPSTLTVTDGETAAAPPAPPTRSGYTFAGWNTQPDGSGTVFDGTTVVSGNVTVYAQWSLNPPNAPANLQASPGERASRLVLGQRHIRRLLQRAYQYRFRHVRPYAAGNGDRNPVYGNGACERHDLLFRGEGA
jgi:Listeria/Bacterioides repeat